MATVGSVIKTKGKGGILVSAKMQKDLIGHIGHDLTGKSVLSSYYISLTF